MSVLTGERLRHLVLTGTAEARPSFNVVRVVGVVLLSIHTEIQASTATP
jgi:hypothetical protein